MSTENRESLNWSWHEFEICFSLILSCIFFYCLSVLFKVKKKLRKKENVKKNTVLSIETEKEFTKFQHLLLPKSSVNKE